ncbi:MAG: WD40 repeat domain-containing serine/threonine protein kinase [Pirellulales bacterium]
MNSDVPNGEPQRLHNGTAEELFESLLEQFDTASAHGQTPRDLNDTRLPPELRAQLAGLGQCLSLLNEAARSGVLTTFDPLTSAAEPFQSPAPQPADSGIVGEHIGRFQILRELGRGGYGVVFLARDAATGRDVALKLPRPEALITPQLRARFLREAQAAGRLDHPHVLQIYEVGEDGGLCYLISPYCRGPTLARWLTENRRGVDVREAAHLVACLADGLEQAHQHGVLHRDIKPGNVLLDLSATEQPASGTRLAARGVSTFVPKLSDFGLAKLVQEGEHETRTGALLGTPAYMAPEQAAGRLDEVGAATDIYALGAVLYELLTGQPPHVGKNDADTMNRIGSMTTVPPRRLRAAIPRDLEAITLKCLEKAPSDRYASAYELARDLRRFLAGESTLARPSGPLRKLWRFVCRRPAVSTLAMAAAILAVTVAAGGWWYSARIALDEAALQRNWYARDMRAAIDARQHGEYAQARALLARYANGMPGSSLRDFEWYWLRQALHEEKLVVRAGHGEAYAATFSPDSKTLYTGGMDGVIRAWSVESGAPLFELPGHTSCVNQLAFAPDGHTLASASCDHTVRMWDTRERREIGTLGEHPNEVFSLGFSHQGAWLATGANDGRVRVWDLAEKRLVQTLTVAGDHAAVDALAFRKDDEILAVTLGVGPNSLWHTGDWKKLNERWDQCRTLAFVGPDQELVVAGAAGDVVQLRRENEHFLPRHLDHSFTQITSLASLHNSSIGLAAGFDGSVHTFSVGDTSTRRIFNAGGVRVQCVAASPDDRYLAAASFDGEVRVWDLNESDTALPEAMRGVRLVQARLFGPGRLTAAMDDYYRLYVDRGQQGTFEPVTTHHRELRLASDSAKILAAIEKSTERLQLVHADTFTALPHFEDLSNPLAMSVSADDRVLATLDREFVVRAYDIATGRLRCQAPLKRSIDVDHLLLALSPDGSQLVIARHGLLFPDALDTATGRWVPRTTELAFLGRACSWPQEALFAPDGRLAVHMEGADTAVITDVQTGAVLHMLRHDDGFVGHFGWSPDGGRLAILTRRQGVALYDPVSGDVVGNLDGGLEPITSNLIFSADGQQLRALTGSVFKSPSRWRIWRAPRD